MQRIRRRGYQFHNTCNGCRCPLDAGEGAYCEECREENQKLETYARRWDMTVQQVREMDRDGLIIK